MTVKPKVKRRHYSDPSAWPEIRLVPMWSWEHETPECFECDSSDFLYTTMQQAFRAAHYHLRNECESNDR